MERGSSQRDYDAFQAQLQHEDDNLNQKLTWHLMVQSFFFSAYVGVTGEDKFLSIFDHPRGLLIWLIPITALLASVLIYPSVVVSSMYIGDLVREFKKRPSSDASKKPPIYGSPILRKVSHAANLLLPLLIISSWVIILVFQIRRY